MMKNKTIFFQRKNNKSLIVLTALVVGFMAIAVSYAQNINTDEAGQRAKSVLEQVKNPDNPNVPDQKLNNPVVNDDRASGYSVPDLPDYGSANTSADPLAVAERYKNKIYDPTLKNETDLLVFVSFSMPEASLMRIAAEAKKTGAVLVLRGFKDGSYKKTVDATRLINGLGAQVMVHPDLFTQYQITDVPTFVLADASVEEGSCDTGTCNAHYSIKGDVSLQAVLANFEKRTDSQKLTDSAGTRLSALTDNKFYKGQ